MALHYNRVRFSVSGTPGSGAVTVGSAITGYRTPSGASVPDGEQIRVVFEDGTAWEISDCIYTASGTSLARTLEESSTGSLLSLSSSAIGYIDSTSWDQHRVGEVIDYMGHTLPAGFIECDGRNLSRSQYRALFNAIIKASTITITIASPGLVTWNAHGFKQGDPVVPSTSGALPTGLVAGTTYYVSANGLTGNAFRLTATIGGADINTSGSQSGTHTGTHQPFGGGDGSTTFGLPDLRGAVRAGRDNAGGTAASKLTGQAGGVQGLLPGALGGEEQHTDTVTENASHTHTPATGGSFRTNTGSTSIGGATNVPDAVSSLVASGGDGPHNNMQPTAVVPRPCIYAGVV